MVNVVHTHETEKKSDERFFAGPDRSRDERHSALIVTRNQFFTKLRALFGVKSHARPLEVLDASSDRDAIVDESVDASGKRRALELDHIVGLKLRRIFSKSSDRSVDDNGHVFLDTVLHQASGANAGRTGDVPTASVFRASDATEHFTASDADDTTSIAFPQLASGENTSVSRRQFGVIETDGGDEMRSLIIVENLNNRSSALIENLMDFVEPSFITDSFDVLAHEQNTKEAHFTDVSRLESLFELGSNRVGNEISFEPAGSLDLKVGDLIVENVTVLIV